MEPGILTAGMEEVGINQKVYILVRIADVFVYIKFISSESEEKSRNYVTLGHVIFH